MYLAWESSGMSMSSKYFSVSETQSRISSMFNDPEKVGMSAFILDIIGFHTHRSCASPLLNSFDTLDLIRVVPTYHQDKDEDAHAIQDDNPAITKLIHIEYSRDDIAKT
ncbi:hypothetical protein Tco_0105625 [Tanacetum coccineum]